jgi:hypothetical protein
MKTIFDVEKSKLLCPPAYEKSGKGIKFIKRIVVQIKEVTYPSTGNPRVLQVVTENLGPLLDSFTVNGYILTQSPPTVKVDPENPGRFIGLSGYHRITAAKILGWETMIFDVLEFDSPKCERVHKNTTNNHRLPHIAMTKEDIIKQIKEAITAKEIANNDSEISDFINEIADDKTEKTKKLIFKELRKRVSNSATLVNYHSKNGPSSIQEFAAKHNLACEGDNSYNQSGHKLAYMNHSASPKTTLISAKKLSKKHNNQEVLYYTWIEKPMEAPYLYTQRKEHLDRFNKFMEEECEFIQSIAERLGSKLNIEDILKIHPFKFGGFLPQDISPDASKGGLPKEEVLVNYLGNVI